MADTWMKARDTAPVITSVLRDRDLAPVDIALAEVRVYIRTIHGDTVIEDVASNDQVGDGSDGTKGFVSYVIDGGLEPGGYRYEWEVTYVNDAGVETFPNDSYLTLAVLEDLGQEAS